MSWGVLVWHVPLPVPLMLRPPPHGWYACPGQVPKAANPTLLCWCDHLATIFVPSVALEDVTTHKEARNKLTHQALNIS